MLELKECCSVPFPKRLSEEYEVRENAIYANVNASKVLDMMCEFIDSHNEPLFFILELPCEEMDGGITESKMLINVPNDVDVYFIDGMNGDMAKYILDEIGDMLVKDGMNTFGIGGHESHEEILFGKYNVMTVYTQSPEGYRAFFNSFGIKKVPALVTAWETFDGEHGGESWVYVSKETGKTVFDIPERCKEYGMYLYETRKAVGEAAEGEITYDELVGKTILVGMSYCNSNEELIEQKQFYGTIVEASKTHIRFEGADGNTFALPPDLSAIKRARAGEYKLRSTGEVVVNPDFLTTWVYVYPEKQ